MNSADIGDYAFLSDCRGSMLVSSLGTIAWACLPRFDSAPFFASLLGTAEHGCWSLDLEQPVLQRKRHYRPGSLVLETELTTAAGILLITDALSLRTEYPTLLRTLQATRGRVAVRSIIKVRFDYGSIKPLARVEKGGFRLLAGPDSIYLDSNSQLHHDQGDVSSDITCTEGQAPCSFSLSWQPSHKKPRARADSQAELRATHRWWRKWSAQCTYEGEWKDAVLRSLMTLKGLTYAETGAIVAAPTTSLPEWPGGNRNWDYRYVWLRDCAFTLSALLQCGYVEEAQAWRAWLERAAGVDPQSIKTLYGVGGERRLSEYEINWLPGFRNSRPVRVGNAAGEQFQLDIFGEMFAAFALARQHGMQADAEGQQSAVALLAYLANAWREPDEGIWEVRGGRRHFTHSKLMAWVAFDRAVKAAMDGRLSGPHESWTAIRDEIHHDICHSGFSSRKNSFVQSYGSHTLDASLLLMSGVGFLPPDDSRIVSTVDAIASELKDRNGLIRRYATDVSSADGLQGPEGVFLPCSFWLVDAWVMQGRLEEAMELFNKLLQLGNDLGLYSEEYDSESRSMLGNFPQAFTHVALVNSACRLSAAREGGHTNAPGRRSAHP